MKGIYPKSEDTQYSNNSNNLNTLKKNAYKTNSNKLSNNVNNLNKNLNINNLKQIRSTMNPIEIETQDAATKLIIQIVNKKIFKISDYLASTETITIGIPQSLKIRNIPVSFERQLQTSLHFNRELVRNGCPHTKL